MPEKYNHNGYKHNRLMILALIMFNMTFCVILVVAVKMFIPSFSDLNNNQSVTKCECKYKYLFDFTVEDNIPDESKYDQIKTMVIFNQIDTFNGLSLMLDQANPQFFKEIEYEINYLRQQSLIHLKFLADKITYKQWEEDLTYLSSVEMVQLSDQTNSFSSSDNN